MPDPTFFEKAAAALPSPSTEGGSSGYFSRPEQTLDPNLFHGQYIRPEVREYIFRELSDWAGRSHITLANSFHLWIAGSGITYQWAASRGNGDLDVMIGVNLLRFEEDNPAWKGWSENDLAAYINEGMKAGLWPDTSQAHFGDQVYEVTYFWNPGTGNDIR